MVSFLSLAAMTRQVEPWWDEAFGIAAGHVHLQNLKEQKTFLKEELEKDPASCSILPIKGEKARFQTQD